MENIDINFYLPFYIINQIIEYTQLNEENQEKLNRKKFIEILLLFQVEMKELKKEQRDFILRKYFN